MTASTLAAPPVAEPVLSVRDLRLAVRTPQGVVHPLRGVSISVSPGKVLAVLGESGAGKSLTLKGVLGLLPPRVARFSGSVKFQGEELVRASERVMRSIRGNRITMIYQDPVAALDPVFTIGSQVTETIRRHQNATAAEAKDSAIRLLGDLGIPSPEQRMKAFPHEMSGGMCQRVMIAIALACEPDLLLADEPTSALDVTVQAQIISLLREFVSVSQAAIVIVTHDVGVAAELADDVAVMYAGQVVESGPVVQVLEEPAHPYTQALIYSNVTFASEGRLPAIGGAPPEPLHIPRGCAFAPRCPRAIADCEEPPPIVAVDTGHDARCVRLSWRSHRG